MAAEDFASRLEGVLAQAQETVTELGYSWALIGGLAVSARAEPRFTRDVDLAVALKSDAQAEGLIRDLQAQGYRIVTLLEQEDLGRIATVRLTTPDGDHGIILDLLFASSGIEPEIVERATKIEVFPNITLPVARLSDLLALKILAHDEDRRPQDALDIRALLQEASDIDIDQTREALILITNRGYHRDQDLLEKFAQLLQRFSL